jgi:hypothetical protein
VLYCKYCEKTTKAAGKICQIVQIKIVYVQAVYVEEICSLIEPAIIFLERNDNVLFDCCNVFDELLQNFLLKICKPEANNLIIEEQNFDVLDNNPKKIFLKSYLASERLNDAMEKMKLGEQEIADMKSVLFDSTKAIVEYLLKVNFLNDFFRSCKFLSVQHVFSPDAEWNIGNLAELLKFPYNR